MAKKAPCCMGCGAYNYGQVVSAHADWIEYGKGTGIKADDCFVAFLGSDCCHHYLHNGGDSKEIKKDFWRRAYEKTNKWLWESGSIKVA